MNMISCMYHFLNNITLQRYNCPSSSNCRTYCDVSSNHRVISYFDHNAILHLYYVQFTRIYLNKSITMLFLN